ncbi:MAG: DUF427 domain-containing protein [Chloroflexota bacterium]|jgi:uncharacterized protein (DUF427 family)
MTRRPEPVKPGPGQESVWDYPRPPKLEPVTKRIQVVFNGRTVADTQHAWRVLETSHPPVYYLPPTDIELELLKEASGGSYCEWKGRASYYDVVVADRMARRAAWTYRSPAAEFSQITDHVAFYAWAMDACLVDGERVRPQPGQFYGGWITADIVGPFKGEPGSSGW